MVQQDTSVFEDPSKTNEQYWEEDPTREAVLCQLWEETECLYDSSKRGHMTEDRAAILKRFSTILQVPREWPYINLLPIFTMIITTCQSISSSLHLITQVKINLLPFSLLFFCIKKVRLFQTNFLLYFIHKIFNPTSELHYFQQTSSRTKWTPSETYFNVCTARQRVEQNLRGRQSVRRKSCAWHISWDATSPPVSSWRAINLRKHHRNLTRRLTTQYPTSR